MKNILTILSIVVCTHFAYSQTSTTAAKKDLKNVTVDHSHDGHNHDGHTHDAQPATAPTPPNPNAPKLSFKEETFDFGAIPEGPQVTHEFKFKNEGKEPLVLTNVKASCGCTTPSWPKEPVLPGKEAVITATYNTQGRPGAFSKTITITSNASESNKIIFIKGEVVKAEQEKTIPVAEPSMLAPK